MPQRPVLERFSIALPLLGGAMVLMANLLPNYATFLWVFGLFLLIAGLVTAVAAWNRKRMTEQPKK